MADPEAMTLEDAIALLKQLGTPISDGAVMVPIPPERPNAPPLPDSSEKNTELLKAEARYRTLVEQLPAVTFMASLEGGINEIYVSPQIEKMLGFTQKEWLEDPILWYRQLHPEDKERWNAEFAKMIVAGTVFQSDYRFISRHGHVVWVRGAAKLVRNADGCPSFIQGIAFDITHLKEAEQKIRAALKEKELLLKEVHHRVKNNLQITSSLLSLQAAEISDPQMRARLLESENRIKSMALVHEKLYQSKNFAQIAVADYVEELSQSLLQSYGVGHEQIEIKSRIENLVVGIDKAIPLGLILNELISNAVKHAFPEGKTGKIFITFSATQGGVCLTVSDNGVGFPAGFDFKSPKRLGLQLVKDLAYQLGGQAELIESDLTRFEVKFQL